MKAEQAEAQRAALQSELTDSTRRCAVTGAAFGFEWFSDQPLFCSWCAHCCILCCLLFTDTPERWPSSRHVWRRRRPR